MIEIYKRDLIRLGFQQSKENPNHFYRVDGEVFINEGGSLADLLDSNQNQHENHVSFVGKIRKEIEDLNAKLDNEY